MGFADVAVTAHDAEADPENAWRTGPVDISQAAAAHSAQVAEASQYTAFGRTPEHVIRDPSHRKRLAELHRPPKPRRISQRRLRELSTTKLGLQLEQHMASLSAASAQELGARPRSAAPRRRPRPRSAAPRVRLQRPVRLKDVPAEQLEALRLTLSACNLPERYASALAASGFDSVGALALATFANLRDVGLTAPHARTLRRLLDSSFDDQGEPLAPTPEAVAAAQAREEATRAREERARARKLRPASAPAGSHRAQGRAVAVELGAGPTPQLPGGGDASPVGGAADSTEDGDSGLEAILASMEAAKAGLSEPSEEVVKAQIANAAADVAADLIAGAAKTSPKRGRGPSRMPARRATLDEMEEKLQSVSCKIVGGNLGCVFQRFHSKDRANRRRCSWMSWRRSSRSSRLRLPGCVPTAAVMRRQGRAPQRAR